MSLGRQKDRQSDLLLSWDELPRLAGHPFYDQLQDVLQAAGFDRYVEDLCKPYSSSSARGRSSLPPGRYFRMLLVGYFEGLDSERGIEWRSSDSLSLREFLLLSSRENVPDHILDVEDAFALAAGRSRGDLCLGSEATGRARLGEGRGDWRRRLDPKDVYGEANAALRAIVRRDSGEGYREMLQRLAKESGIETPTADDLVRLDRQRPGKKLSNEDWESSIDPDARIAKMKDGRTRLAYKPEHAVDLDTGAIIAAPIHSADQGDTKTLSDTLKVARASLEAVGKEPSQDDPAELVADKGYHSRDGLKGLEESVWKSRVSEPKPKDILPRLQEQSSEGRARHAGSSPRCGCDNVQKRYLIHISGYNLSLIMRLLTGFGTPRSLADAKIGVIWMRYTIDSHDVVAICYLVVIQGPSQVAVIEIQAVLLAY